MKLLTISAILATTTFASTAGATCLKDNSEIGDIGPTSAQVCRDLESSYPGSDVTVKNREIMNRDLVAVVARVDGKPVRMDYLRTGWNGWRTDR